MSTTPAGWYPDPEREGATRWWDGAQWAPSQDPAATDDRFKPRDDANDASATDAVAPGLEDTFTPGAAAADWSPTPGNEWGPQATGQQPSAEPSWQQPAASAPSYGETPSYGQAASAPSYGQPAGQEQPSWQQYGDAQQPTYGQPQYGQPGDATTANQWNQYGAQPKKNRTGLIIGIAAGALVLVLGLVIGGGFLVTNLISGAQQNQSQTQGGSTGGGSQGGGTTGGPGSFELSIPENGSGVQTIDITTAGTYQIDVLSLNGEDPNVTVEGTGTSSFYAYDDDGGDGLDSQLIEYLEVGSYTLTVEEFTGDQLDVSVSITQR